MSENDKLDLILSEINGMKTEIGGLKTEIGEMKDDIQQVKQRTADIGMHIENHTDKNILLIAEHFVDMTNRLNQAIPAADKNLAYEVKVDYVFEKERFWKKILRS